MQVVLTEYALTRSEGITRLVLPTITWNNKQTSGKQVNNKQVNNKQVNNTPVSFHIMITQKIMDLVHFEAEICLASNSI